MSHFVPIMDKIHAKTRVEGSCWVWTGTSSRGYGLVGSRGKTYRVHRVAWIELRGPLKPSVVLDHVCRNKLCWNPDHLRPVSQLENVVAGVGWAGVNSRREKCPAGHRYPPYVPGGRRLCKECKRVGDAASYRRHAHEIAQRRQERKRRLSLV